MARDTYEMTSPMRFLSYGFGVATYIPPTVAVLGFKTHCPVRQPSTLLVPPLYLPALRIDLALHTYAADS